MKRVCVKRKGQYLCLRRRRKSEQQSFIGQMEKMSDEVLSLKNEQTNLIS